MLPLALRTFQIRPAHHAQERVPVFNDLCMVCWSDLKGESK